MSTDEIINKELNNNSIIKSMIYNSNDNANNKILIKIHTELKVLLSGCKHILDGHNIGILFKNQHPEYSEFITNIINGKIYENTMSIARIQETIVDISLLKYKEDVIDLIDNICDGRTINEVQKRAFLRMSKMKIMKPFVIFDKPDIDKKSELERKNCPHCGNLCIAPHDSEYIICGYSDSQKGYDFHGCGKDWCFKCGKILCKVWDRDTLFLELHRFHNNNCCEDHAEKYNKKYPEDYCQCINQYVNRNGIPFDLGFLLKK